jgi:hypothetical protein
LPWSRRRVPDPRILGGALVEKIAISAHAAKAAFIDGAAMA